MALQSINVRILDDRAKIPTRAHSTDAGLDIYALEDTEVTEGTLIPTGIAVSIPAGYEAQVRPRSGVTSRTDLRVQLGTVDSGYEGEIKVIGDCKSRLKLFRKVTRFFGLKDRIIEDSHQVYGGDKIAQLVISPIETPKVNLVSEFESESERGDKGFGSTDEKETIN